MSAVVNQEECTGCGVCIEVCPVQAISLDLKRKAQIDSEKCIECGSCVRECPNQAIELVQETAYPLAQRDLPQATTTASVPASTYQTGGTLRAIFQKLPALWEAVRPVVNTIRPPQFRSNNSLSQKGRKGRGKRHRHRGGRR